MSAWEQGQYFCMCPCSRDTPHDQRLPRFVVYDRCPCSLCGHHGCHVRTRRRRSGRSRLCWVCQAFCWQNEDYAPPRHDPRDPDGGTKRKRESDEAEDPKPKRNKRSSASSMDPPGVGSTTTTNTRAPQKSLKFA